MLVGGCVGVGLIVLIGLLSVLGRDDDSATTKRSDRTRGTSTTETTFATKATPIEVTPEKTTPPPERPPDDNPPPAQPPDDTPPPEKPPKEITPPPETVPGEDPTPPSTAPAVAPSETVRQENLEALRSILAEDYRKADHNRDDKLALVENLLELADGANSDPAGRFVMLTEALRLAGESGELTIAGKAIEMLTAGYRVDHLQLQQETFERLQRATIDDQTRQAVVRQGLDLAAEALEADLFAEAEQLVGDARQLALKVVAVQAKVDPRQQAESLATSIRLTKRMWEKCAGAFEVVRQRPDDPDANLTVGRYLCFVRRDWPRGLSHLAKGSDLALKSLARDDSARPTGALDVLNVGDRWWNLADTLELKVEQKAARGRAGYWYEKALPALKKLATRNKVVELRVEKRVAEIAGATSGSSDPSDPATRPGPPLPTGPIPGLIGRATVNGVDTGLVLRTPAGSLIIDRSVRTELMRQNIGITEKSIRIELTAVLQVPLMGTAYVKPRRMGPAQAVGWFRSSRNSAPLR